MAIKCLEIIKAKRALNTGNFRELLKIEQNEKGIVMLSGGMDSTVALFLALNLKFDLVGLEFFYAGRPKIEIERVKKICELVNLKNIQIEYPHVSNSILLAENNMIYYALAGNVAKTIGRQFIIAGPILTDWYRTGIKNACPEYYSRLNEMLALEYPSSHPRIVTPLIYLNKRQVVKLGRLCGAPLELTWSCPNDNKTPCGNCPQCKERAEALK